MGKIFNFEAFAGGALIAKLNQEGEKIVQNIYDPNTDWKKARKLTVTLTFKPSEDRSLASVEIQAKSNLQPAIPVSTNIMIDRDIDTGIVMASELRNKLPGQMGIDIEHPDNPEVKDDSAVIDLKKVNINK